VNLLSKPVRQRLIREVDSAVATTVTVHTNELFTSTSQHRLRTSKLHRDKSEAE